MEDEVEEDEFFDKVKEQDSKPKESDIKKNKQNKVVPGETIAPAKKIMVVKSK